MPVADTPAAVPLLPEVDLSSVTVTWENAEQWLATVGLRILLTIVLAVVALWLRAARHDPAHRRTALTYAVLIAVAQAGWIALLLVNPPLGGAIAAWVVLVAFELAVPIVAERVGGRTPWHPHHITERYGLFTLILLGESLLASANAIIEALHDETALAPLISISVLTLVVTASLW